MTGSPPSPSRLERNCPHPPGTSSQNGQGGQAPPRPADIRARQPPRFTTTTTCARQFLPYPWPDTPRYTSLGFQTRTAPTHRVRARPGNQRVCAVTRPGLTGSRPSRLEAQPLLNHRRQSYGSRTNANLNSHRELTCPYLNEHGYARNGRRSGRPLPQDLRPGPLDRV